MGNCILGKSDSYVVPNSGTSSTVSSPRPQNLCSKDYRIKSLIGSGSTSQVFLVQKKGNGKHYAMKVINKNDVKQNNEIKHIKAERVVLEKLDHPFLVKFYKAFQTKQKLHLILEYANGGDLYTYLNYQMKISERQCQFYAAEIVCALEYLHKNGIIFRGLKPEDVLIDSDGHIKISDFGLAKSEASNTSTFWGSPLYLAPEVIKGEKQTKAIDYWSLGVLIFEMLTGAPPFYDQDSKKLLKAILERNIEFPTTMSDDAKNLISWLLKPSPSERLGNGAKGFKEIKEHRFFKDFNWSKVKSKGYRPPFTPMLKSESDLEHVDFLFKSGKINRHTSRIFKEEFSGSMYENYTFVGLESGTIKSISEVDEFKFKGGKHINES